MEELKKLYTVDDIAKMTGFTSRTIRNYLKNGSLQGQKIGGQWRFTMDNIKKMFNDSRFITELSDHKKQQVLDFIDGVNTDITGEIQVCSIVDYCCDSQKEGQKIYEKLVKVINSREDGSPPTRFDYEFIGKENKARFILFGNPDYIIKTLQLI
jgi:excisionase family DNA binding protein